MTSVNLLIIIDNKLRLEISAVNTSAGLDNIINLAKHALKHPSSKKTIVIRHDGSAIEIASPAEAEMTRMKIKTVSTRELHHEVTVTKYDHNEKPLPRDWREEEKLTLTSVLDPNIWVQDAIQKIGQVFDF